VCYAFKTFTLVVLESLAGEDGWYPQQEHLERLIATRELHSFTPAESLFPKLHMGFIDVSGHLLSSTDWKLC